MEEHTSLISPEAISHQSHSLVFSLQAEPTKPTGFITQASLDGDV
jgi:hypothetical protein